MANAIINNGSFLNSSGSPNKSNPFTVYSSESLNVGDIVSYNPYIRASSSNLSDSSNGWNYEGYVGNIIFCIGIGNLITLRLSTSSSLSSHTFSIYNIYAGTGVSSSVKEHSSFDIVIAIDDTHLAAFSRAMYAGSEVTYTQPRISILSLNQSTGEVSLIESYLLSSESNSIYSYYTKMVIVDGDIVMIGGPYGTTVLSTVYLSSNYTISGVYHSTFTSGIITAHHMVPDSAHRYLFLFSSANTNSYQRLLIPTSNSKITVESKTFTQNYEIDDAYMLDGKIILQSYPSYTHKIYSLDPSSLSIVMIHNMANNDLMNTRSKFSRLIDEHFYFVTTSDSGDNTWVTLIDIETNQMIFPMTEQDYIPSPIEPSMMQNRYYIRGYSSDKRIYVYDARRVIKYTINTGIPGAVVTSVIGNGAYEVQSLS